MSDNVTFVLHPDTEFGEFLDIWSRIMALSAWIASKSAKPSVQVVLAGGPGMLLRDDPEMIRKLFPDGLLENILIDGRSLPDDLVIDVE